MDKREPLEDPDAASVTTLVDRHDVVLLREGRVRRSGTRKERAG